MTTKTPNLNNLLSLPINNKLQTALPLTGFADCDGFADCAGFVAEIKDKNGKVVKVVELETLKLMILNDLAKETKKETKNETKNETKKETRNETESYSFNWVGKKASILKANTKTTKKLIPKKEESLNWNATENLYIEGDNLDALKILQNNYKGKIKVIYIDPPYNTGNDFLYNDNFTQSKKDYIKNFADNENTTLDGRYHSNWCSMITPRLILAKKLLTDDGVIFISIDDNEVANLRKICDEIFGANSFIATFKWNRVKKAPGLSGSVRTKYEYILAYYNKIKIQLYGKASYNKQAPLWHLPNKKQELTFAKNSIRIKKDFLKGYYGGTYNVELLDDIICENGLNKHQVRIIANSAWGQEKINQYIKSGKTFEIKKNITTVYTDIDNENKFIAPSDIINSEECGVKCNTDANEEMKSLGVPFDYSKPISLISYLINMATYNCKNSAVLDFFSGSATTAHATMELNAKDKGNRKFIMVQIPEKCDEKSKAYTQGFKNICEIGKERIKRAGIKIKKENPLTTKNLDVGFKVFKIDD